MWSNQTCLLALAVACGVKGLSSTIWTQCMLRRRQFKTDTLVLTCLGCQIGMLMWAVHVSMWTMTSILGSEQDALTIATGVSLVLTNWVGFMTLFFFALMVVRVLFRSRRLSPETEYIYSYPGPF